MPTRTIQRRLFGVAPLALVVEVRLG